MGLGNALEKDFSFIVRMAVSGIVGFLYGISLWLNMRKHVFEVNDSTLQGKTNFVGYFIVAYTSLFQIICGISLSWARVASVSSLLAVCFGISLALVVFHDHVKVDLNEEKYHPFLISCTVLILTTLAFAFSVSWLTNVIIVFMFSSVLAIFFFASN